MHCCYLQATMYCCHVHATMYCCYVLLLRQCLCKGRVEAAVQVTVSMVSDEVLSDMLYVHDSVVLLCKLIPFLSVPFLPLMDILMQLPANLQICVHCGICYACSRLLLCYSYLASQICRLLFGMLACV